MSEPEGLESGPGPYALCTGTEAGTLSRIRGKGASAMIDHCPDSIRNLNDHNDGQGKERVIVDRFRGLLILQLSLE